MPDKEILDIEEISLFLRIPKGTVYKMCERGKIPYFNAVKRLRFSMRAIDNWIERQERAKTKKKPSAAKKVKPSAQLKREPDVHTTASTDVVYHRYNNSDLATIKASLGTKIKLYKKRAQEVERYLEKNPKDWSKFQEEFNSAVDAIFRDIMEFEKENLAKGRPEKVVKLKNLFINRIRRLFMRKDYSDWSIRKPLGYAGDYKIIDDIYLDKPKTTGFDRLFDNYYQRSSICIGVRNRKEDIKKYVSCFVNSRLKDSLRIMNLASGSCRDIKEIYADKMITNKNIVFDCYDNDERAHSFAKKLLAGATNVSFFKENALRLAAAKDITEKIKEKYDLIYSAGLFDYFNDKICIKLIHNLRGLLKDDGCLLIANVRDKYSNPSFHYMEWAGDWKLIYRSDEGFRKVFVEAGFNPKQLDVQFEKQSIMQYIIASNAKSSLLKVSK